MGRTLSSSPEGEEQQFLLKSWQYCWVEMTVACGILAKLPLVTGRGTSVWSTKRAAHWQTFRCQLKCWKVCKGWILELKVCFTCCLNANNSKNFQSAQLSSRTCNFWLKSFPHLSQSSPINRNSLRVKQQDPIPFKLPKFFLPFWFLLVVAQPIDVMLHSRDIQLSVQDEVILTCAYIYCHFINLVLHFRVPLEELSRCKCMISLNSSWSQQHHSHVKDSYAQ